MKTSANEQKIKEIGFKLIKTYKHDQFITNRYNKGDLTVEFTYEGDELISFDLTISEVNYMPIIIEEVEKISELIGHFKDF
jgi:hypothetical protein